MDFSREPFVRIYTGVTPTARTWGFWGRVLMDELVKHADKAGVVELPGELQEDLPVAVASVVGCEDIEWIRKYLPKLLDHGAAQVRGEGQYLVLTRYHEAQYSNVDSNFSNTCSRRKKRDTERAIELGLIAPPFWWTEREEGAA